jgi:hypothetical protein
VHQQVLIFYIHNLVILYQQSDGDNTEDNPTTTGVPSTFQPTTDGHSFQFSNVNPVMGVANLASRRSTGLSLMDQRGMDAMGIGRGPLVEEQKVMELTL